MELEVQWDWVSGNCHYFHYPYCNHTSFVRKLLNPHSRWELYSTFLRVVCLHKLFRICLPKRFFSHLYLVNQPFNQYDLMHIYSILWVIIQYYIIYFDTQIVSALAINGSFSWFLCPSGISLIVVRSFFFLLNFSFLFPLLSFLLSFIAEYIIFSLFDEHLFFSHLRPLWIKPL